MKNLIFRNSFLLNGAQEQYRNDHKTSGLPKSAKLLILRWFTDFLGDQLLPNGENSAENFNSQANQPTKFKIVTPLLPVTSYQAQLNSVC
jgi:hypothetical protein